MSNSKSTTAVNAPTNAAEPATLEWVKNDNDDIPAEWDAKVAEGVWFRITKFPRTYELSRIEDLQRFDFLEDAFARAGDLVNTRESTPTDEELEEAMVILGDCGASEENACSATERDGIWASAERAKALIRSRCGAKTPIST